MRGFVENPNLAAGWPRNSDFVVSRLSALDWFGKLSVLTVEAGH